ncbi:P-loop containing nucleoside triphosphate hydrolase protein [Mrakia frigida]|uniref:P-loop containing nucleoside triphosphate hydrolase protein n=1 Tax=Mrakia frigida TaxID=29902 RepID=UPI003FCBFA02
MGISTRTTPSTSSSLLPSHPSASSSSSSSSTSSFHTTSTADSSRPPTPSTPRRTPPGGGFVPLASGKFPMAKETRGVRPQSQQLSSSSFDIDNNTNNTNYEVLSELNGGSSIRRVVQRKKDEEGNETSWKPSTTLPLILPLAASAPPPPPSSFNLNLNRSQTHSTPTAPSASSYSTSGLRAPTPSSKLKPLTLQSTAARPPPPPPSSADSPTGFFPKFKAKLTDSTRPKKKTFLGGTSQAHIVTPARAFAHPQHQPRKVSVNRIIRSSEDEEEEEDAQDWNLVEQEEEDDDDEDEFWAGEVRSKGEKENVKVSIRVRPLNPLSVNDQAAWDTTTNSLKIMDEFQKRGAKEEWVFDHVVSGSDNKEIYETAARDHVRSAMEGFNAVVFAYGQTASGKTFTLTGSKSEPGVIPRAIEDVFSFIKKNNKREFLLRASYLEIYNEVIKDLLNPATASVEIRGSSSNDITLHPVREEVVTNPAQVREILARGEASRRTAVTDWNERSSRSHSVFRLVIESREKPLGGGDGGAWVSDDRPLGRTPSAKSKSNAGKATRTSTLSLIDLAGSEKATSDKARSAEGKYINTSLLALKQVIATIAKNESKKEHAHVAYRNSKLTRMLQPSLSGDSKVSVICTLNPSAQALSETNSTLNFATGLKLVRLTATKKEVIEDPHALIQQYQVEIAQLKQQLQEKEVPKDSSRRLSRREEQNISQYRDRIRDLSSLILTSQTVEEEEDEDGPVRPVSPTKVDFESTGIELRRELFTTKMKVDEQAVTIDRLEEALRNRPTIGTDAPESAKDAHIRTLESQLALANMINQGYESNLGEPLRKVAEDVAKEWRPQVEEWKQKEADARKFGNEVAVKLEKEAAAHKKLKEIHSQLVALASETHLLSHSASTATLAPPRPSSPSGSIYSLTIPSGGGMGSGFHGGDDLLGVNLPQTLRGEGSSWDLGELRRTGY